MIWQNIVSIVLYSTAIVGLVCYKQINPIQLRAFVIWYVVWALTDGSFYLFYDYFPNGRLIRVAYCLLDPFHYLIYAYVFLLTSHLKQPFKIAIWLTFILFILFALYQVFYRIDDKNAANDSFLIKSVLILLIVLYYFWTLIQSNQIIIPSKEPLFWIATGSLFFFTGNIISSGFFHELFSYSKEWARILFKLSYILEIVLYLFSILAFVLSSKGENNGR